MSSQATADQLRQSVSSLSLLITNTNENLQLQLDSGEGATGILSISLNDFRRITVSYGYDFGERLMWAVYHRLVEGLPKRDRVYWLGRNEFVIVLTNLRVPENLQRAIDKTRSLLYQPFSTGDSKLTVRYTMGASLSQRSVLNAGDLLREADEALLEAQDTALEYAIFDASRRKEVDDGLVLQSHLESALRDNQLSLVYQPKVDFRTRRVTSVEALMRWHSPELGHVLPDKFIIAAEKTGMIGPMTEWAIRTAVKQYSDWGRFKVPIAVNLSAEVLSDPHLLDLIDRSLEIWSVPKAALTLEITETAMMNRPEHCIGVMKQLRDHGLRLSIDDFGTGYSSLAYLKDLPVDELKIDKSFVDNLLTDEDDRKIVSAVSSLARNFDLKTVAEGVEDHETFEYLRKLGCNVAQGYYIAKPMPPEEFPQWRIEWANKTRELVEQQKKRQATAKV